MKLTSKNLRHSITSKNISNYITQVVITDVRETIDGTDDGFKYLKF